MEIVHQNDVASKPNSIPEQEYLVEFLSLGRAQSMKRPTRVEWSDLAQEIERNHLMDLAQKGGPKHSQKGRDIMLLSKGI